VYSSSHPSLKSPPRRAPIEPQTAVATPRTSRTCHHCWLKLSTSKEKWASQNEWQVPYFWAIPTNWRGKNPGVAKPQHFGLAPIEKARPARKRCSHRTPHNPEVEADSAPIRQVIRQVDRPGRGRESRGSARPGPLPLKPPPSCGWPRAWHRPAPPGRRSPDGSDPSAWRSTAPACRHARYWGRHC